VALARALMRNAAIIERLDVVFPQDANLGAFPHLRTFFRETWR
jgi:hypothetical protein